MNCTSGNTKIKVAWLHYLAGEACRVTPLAFIILSDYLFVAMIFDAVAMGISTGYLIAQTSNLSLCVKIAFLLLGGD